MTHLSSIFSAIGEPTRLAIVERLLREGECPVGQLLDVADITPPAMTRHLKVLHEAGIVHRRIDRQRRIYSVRPEALEAVETWVISHRAFWEGSLSRLQRALKDEMDNQ